MPIDPEARLHFNARRSFTIRGFLSKFSRLELEEACVIQERRIDREQELASMDYRRGLVVGLFHLRRRAQTRGTTSRSMLEPSEEKNRNRTRLSQLAQPLRRLPGAERGWGMFRRFQLHRQYAQRRERYARICQRKSLVYREQDVVADVRRRLASRGYTPASRAMGQVHTFAFIPRKGWHVTLYPDLEELGPVSAFDYNELGYTWEEFWAQDTAAVRRRREMLAQLLPAVRTAHGKRPIDWVFIYGSGVEITTDAIRAITDELGVPVVNMCLDDKQSWEGPTFDGQRVGQVDIGPTFDISWTSARVACEWYLCEGARPIYLPEGFDQRSYSPLPVDQNIPVSFIGGAYGFRPAVISYLRRNRVPVQVFGSGWDGGFLKSNEQAEIINRSQINLGMGGIGYSEELTNVKGRDFEIPGSGGGLYLTSFNPDLAQHFHVGKEIVCYRNRAEMVELIRYYLARPEEAREIALRARRRCLGEHRWLHRYQRICRILGVLLPADDGLREGNARHDAKPPFTPSRVLDASSAPAAGSEPLA